MDDELVGIIEAELLGAEQGEMTKADQAKLGINAGAEILSKIVDAADKSKKKPADTSTSAVVKSQPSAENFLSKYRTPLIVGGVAVGGVALVLMVMKMAGKKGRR